MSPRRKVTLSFAFLTFLVLSPLFFSSDAFFVLAYEKPDKERYFVSKETGYLIENNRRLSYERYDEILLKNIEAVYDPQKEVLNASYLVFNPGERGISGKENISVSGSNFLVSVVKSSVNGEEVITGLNVNYYFFRAPTAETFILSGDVISSLKPHDLLITKFNTSEERIYIAFQYTQWNGEEFENVFVELSTDNDPSGLVEKIGIHFVIENQDQRPIQESHLTIRQMTYYEQYVKTISIIRLLVDLWLVWLSIAIFVLLVVGKKKWENIKHWIINKLGGTIPANNVEDEKIGENEEKT